MTYDTASDTISFPWMDKRDLPGGPAYVWILKFHHPRYTKIIFYIFSDDSRQSVPVIGLDTHFHRKTDEHMVYLVSRKQLMDDRNCQPILLGTVSGDVSEIERAIIDAAGSLDYVTLSRWFCSPGDGMHDECRNIIFSALSRFRIR